MPVAHARGRACRKAMPRRWRCVVEDMSHFIDMIGSFGWETDFGPYQYLNLNSDRGVRYEPHGVVGAITPWNAPFMPDMWKINGAFALATP